ncbi:hypothetical protein GSI_04278 [Ganoderma sinense ZZ0214-1]|uniref:ATP phosphoribosyltransferase n=1 Tax=Ganoderma sinense ZZ0214-1 TaxID=1077348 RepID=A0A2G8SIP8_9APHY|nr:hypothetical protein GSI_04278 [Ganoderma sinense ZZ0214-1]
MTPTRKLKLVFFIPRASTQAVLRHLFARFPNHVGRIGAYGGCAFVSPGVGQFLPLEGANPAIGEVGRPEHVEEDRVEVLVLGAREREDPGGQGQGQGPLAAHGHSAADAGDGTGTGVEMAVVLEELKKVHPYEEVAYDVYRLEDF